MSIPPPPPEHVCDLPRRDSGYGSTGYPVGHLIRCRSGCGRWYICRPCYESLGPTTWWRPVHWWNRKLRKRIAEEDA